MQHQASFLDGGKHLQMTESIEHTALKEPG